MPLSKREFLLSQWLLDPKILEGALKSAIHAHGPIALSRGNSLNKIVLCTVDEFGNHKPVEQTICTTSSAAKRLRGALKTRLAEYMENLPAESRKNFFKRMFRI